MRSKASISMASTITRVHPKALSQRYDIQSKYQPTITITWVISAATKTALPLTKRKKKEYLLQKQFQGKNHILITI